MRTILTKIASILAFTIGGMAIVAGGQVLLGKDPGYYVVNWVPVYNYTVGILTVFVTAILIWTYHRFALPAAIATLGFHGVVMLILQTIYSSVVAPESIRAMTIRLVAWVIILGLLFAHSCINKTVQTSNSPSSRS